MASEHDVKSAFKLAQLVNLSRTTEIKMIEKILEQEGDINFAIPVNSPCRISKPETIGYTALHFACSNNINLFKSLLNHGADFTKKDQNGNTALHNLMITTQTDIKEPLHNAYVDAVLSAHINSRNFSNPCNKNGLSHFHIACMTSNTKPVQFFLDSDVLVDDPVGIDSKFFPGYTALHFAAMCSNTKVVEILVAHGANMHIADAKGATILHILLTLKLEMTDSLRKLTVNRDQSHQILKAKVEENDKIINLLMENMSSDNDCLDSIGLSNFHVACTLLDITIAEQLADKVTDLDQCVNMNSLLWPGYTALHFAAHVSMKTVEMLINKGANLLAQDSKGMTPLDICIERYKIEDVCDIMFLNSNLRNILFSDGETKLILFLRTFADQNYFKNFLASSIKDINLQISMKSPLWPGYTPLHLAVHFTETSKSISNNFFLSKHVANLDIVKLCLKNGADLKLQDSKGGTALHLAYRLCKQGAADMILRECTHIPNVSDEENLSHLHIVCAMASEKNTMKKCTIDDSVVNTVFEGTSTVNNVRPGSTALHVFLSTEFISYSKLNILLKAGANPCIKDATGLTPIHRLMETCNKWDRFLWDETKLLFAKSLDCMAEEYGLNHLHVACLILNKAFVKRLVKLGANVNLAITSPQQNDNESLEFLSSYDKCTPLNIAPIYDEDIIQILLKNGADVFAKKADGSCALDNSRVLEYYISEVQKKTRLQKSMRREFGWTKLHLACFVHQIDGFENLVKTELADINAQVNSNSPIWKGCTPLHLLITCGAKEKVYKISKVLLENGADVTATDDKGMTPIEMLMPFNVHMNKEKLRYKQAALLMKYYKDFDVNPVNAQGMSYFHLACYLNDLDAVKEFLSHGVDVNHPIDFFATWNPGFTPLHLASQLEVVDLLIRHGADIQKEDVRGRSVLTEALSRKVFDENVTKIIQSGSTIDSCNICGQTSFEMVLSKNTMTMEKLEFCIKQGFHVNSCNPVSGIGYIAIVLRENSEQMSIAEAMAKENPVTIFGRSTLHNIVAGNNLSIYLHRLLDLFEKVLKSGCDIDAQDEKGRTALHLAVEFENRVAVEGLLRLGPDVNLLDTNGNPAISYILQKSPSHVRDNIKNTFIEYFCKLDFLKLYLSKTNADAIAGKNFDYYYWKRLFLEQVDKTKQIDIGVRSISLHDFLTETGAIILYPSLNQSERSKIHEFFEEINKDTSLNDIQCILKLQYRKAVKRGELLSSATNSFRWLLDFALPDLCTENIFQYLCNSDLTNIISAEIEFNEMKMDVD